MTEKAQFSGIYPMLYGFFDKAEQPGEFGLQPVERWSANLGRFSEANGGAGVASGRRWPYIARRHA